MKHAAAMKYGGELVDAADCTYDSFKELVPLCPECKEPVFLRVGGDRTSLLGKAYQIGPHWCHFKGISAEQVASCESRVNGYTEKDKQRIAAKARGQRLKLLQRWFWSITRKTLAKGMEGETVEGIDEKIALMSQLALKYANLSHAYSQTASHLIELTKRQYEMTEMVGLFVEQMMNDDGVDEEDEDEDEKEWVNQCLFAAKDLVRSIGQRLHVLICCEVLCYLTTKSNRGGLLQKFIDAALWNVCLNRKGYNYDANVFFDSVTINDLSHSFLSNLVYIPWASEFQRLEAESQQRKGAA